MNLERSFWIFVAAEVAAVFIASAFENAGFNALRAFWMAFLGINFAFLTAGLIVADHEARGRGK